MNTTEFLQALHLTGITIIAVLAVYSYYLSWKVNHLKYELANKEAELNLRKSEQHVAEAKMELWHSRIRELAFILANKIALNDKITVIEQSA